MKRSYASILIVLALMLPSPAHADTSWHMDGDDTHGVLDLKRLVQGHRSDPDGRLVRHRIIMFTRWGRADLRHQRNFINIFFSLDDDMRPERRLTIDVENGRLKAQMDRFPSGRRVGTAKVWRADKRSVSVAFPRSFLADVGSYRWRVNSFFHSEGEGPCGTPSDVVRTCVDHSSSFRHSL